VGRLQAQPNLRPRAAERSFSLILLLARRREVVRRRPNRQVERVN
jgi:hypothetical protein